RLPASPSSQPQDPDGHAQARMERRFHKARPAGWGRVCMPATCEIGEGDWWTAASAAALAALDTGEENRPKNTVSVAHAPPASAPGQPPLSRTTSLDGRRYMTTTSRR